jgi:hypothetical protein
MKPLNSIQNKTIILLSGLLVLALFGQSLFAQEIIGAQEIRWLRVGELHAWYSNAGAEVEYGRRGRACCQAEDQTDNFYWQALYQNSDRNVCRGFWLMASNYTDPVTKESYNYKVVQAGPRFCNMLTNVFPEEGTFKMIGRFNAPIVVVDGDVATENFLNDQVDEIDPDLPADRMIINVLNTNTGLSLTRKILAFSQQYHNNYHIFEYVLKNTGIVDPEGTTVSRTLEGIYFAQLYRHAPGWEGTRYAGWTPSNAGWGKNTVHDVFGQDPEAGDFEMRGFFSYYAPHSGGLGYEEEWGSPRPDQPFALAAPAFIGAATIYADKGPADHSDDLYQPKATPFLGADGILTSSIDSENSEIMSQQYNALLIGHPADGDLASQVGNDFADRFGTDAGGYIQCIGYGPYTLAPGDSIRIVNVEAVDGLDRFKSLEVGTNWYLQKTSYTMPDGSTTSDRNAYKKAWVWTAQDSIMETYRRAIRNYNSGYQIPKPPPPPEQFEVKSGGDRILLSWADNAISWPNFDGYRVYRALGRVDTFYTQIFSCGASDAVHEFEDVTAQRGIDYYYYIQTKDDGSTNDIQPGVPLTSSRYYTVTNTPAYLRRPAKSDLNGIRIVPNPFHIRARDVQFTDADDRIAFFGLPPMCEIRIYTERGDLVNTINHIDGSGDELWDCTTSSNQIIVSGLYLAYIEVTEDAVDSAGKAVRSGQSVIKKFIVIR